MLTSSEFNKKQILFVFANTGDRMSFKNDNIIIKDKENKIKHQSTCYRLFIVFVVGNISITSGLIQRSQRFGFSICLLTHSLKLYHIIGGLTEGNTILHKCQYEYNELDIGRHIVKNKIENQKNVLNNFRYKSEYVKDCIALLDSYSKNLDNDGLNIREIMGFEGVASKVYFQNVFNNVKWNGRKPRIKGDYVNSALDIGYTILFNIVDALLGVYGFDRYYGVLHRCFYMRKSLVCDVMEPFRPIIDTQVRKSINLKQFKEEDFTVINNRFCLKWENNAKYVAVFINAIIENKEALFMYIQGYYRAVMKKKTASEFPVFEVN